MASLQKTTTSLTMMIDQAKPQELKATTRPRSNSTEEACKPSHSKASKSPNKKKCTSLPSETVEYLKNWMMSPDHIAHPYPTEQEKADIMAKTGIELKQLTNWFVNNRKRYWKPRVEARLRDHTKPSPSPSPSTTVFKPDVSRGSPLPICTTLNSILESAAAGTRRSCLVEIESESETGGRDASTTENTLYDGTTRAVSEHSGSSSESSIMSSEDADDDLSTGQITEERSGRNVQTEYVDVHILRPVSGQTPSIEDVSVLANLPMERILKTFESCALTFRLHGTSGDARKAQRRRDSEIVRLKKHCLKLYLGQMEETPRKRTREADGDDTIPTPRAKFGRRDVDLWKASCETAASTYDNSLPSLEEAAILFGYARC